MHFDRLALVVLASTLAAPAFASDAFSLSRWQPEDEDEADDGARDDAAEAASEAALGAGTADDSNDLSDQKLFEGWSGQVTLGIDGSDGNTQEFNLRIGASADKETTHWNLTNSLAYLNSQNDGQESEDRLRLIHRQERKFSESKWSAFLQEEYTYDEFDTFLHRIGVFAGAGYKLVEDDKQLLKAIGGFGAIYQSGNTVDPGWTPEVFVGGEYDRDLTAKQKIHIDSTVFFAIDGENEARWITNLSWEALLDEEANLSLQAGARNEYDSGTSAPARKNDFEFFIQLAFSY